MNYTFVFNAEEVDLILAGLGELPAKKSVHLLVKMSGEIQKQNGRKPEPPPIIPPPDMIPQEKPVP